jgi:hypothetical protein
MKVRVLIQRAPFPLLNTGLPCQRARAIQDSASALSNSLAPVRMPRSARLVTRLALTGRCHRHTAAPPARVRDICAARFSDASHILRDSGFCLCPSHPQQWPRATTERGLNTGCRGHPCRHPDRSAATPDLFPQLTDRTDAASLRTLAMTLFAGQVRAPPGMRSLFLRSQGLKILVSSVRFTPCPPKTPHFYER